MSLNVDKNWITIWKTKARHCGITNIGAFLKCNPSKKNIRGSKPEIVCVESKVDFIN